MSHDDDLLLVGVLHGQVDQGLGDGAGVLPVEGHQVDGAVGLVQEADVGLGLMAAVYLQAGGVTPADRACPVFCVSVLQVGVDSVGVGGGELGQGPCIWSVVICPSTSLPLALRLDGGSPFSLSRSRARLSTGVADRQLSAARATASSKRESGRGSSVILAQLVARSLDTVG